jgi:hypothetical protein
MILINLFSAPSFVNLIMTGFIPQQVEFIILSTKYNHLLSPLATLRVLNSSQILSH